MKIIDLSGEWSFSLDGVQEGIKKEYYKKAAFEDSIMLPGTVATAKKGVASAERAIDHLTDPYAFKGYTWYSKEIDLTDTENQEVFLELERTRISHVWIDGKKMGSQDSLCTSHKYQLTGSAKGKCCLTIMVDNASYVVPGGHMTSPDTQTNWNGITGRITLQICEKTYPQKVRIDADCTNKTITVQLELMGKEGISAEVIAQSIAQKKDEEPTTFHKQLVKLQEGHNSFTYDMGKAAKLWSEYDPQLYQLQIKLGSDCYTYEFALREFKATGKYFTINGTRTFLRGKHDGMIFPMTGYAPMDIPSWMQVFATAKSYGINHYRCHTCCLSEAAFAAADRMGIYIEPELPFWGTITGPGDEGHDEVAQQYLIQEGFRILDEFGNHPSFAMMSMGNELWGSKERLENILKGYRTYDNRHLYTQGSNNFQFVPCILENEDFFCGVRFSKNRLFRGSYAMCDAPQGHIQVEAPTFARDYDEEILPAGLSGDKVTDNEVEIQYGTGTKRVKIEDNEEVISNIPVVSHEIGQYGMTPDYTEIDKYTGVLKAENLKIFRERAEQKGLLPMADKFFKASGRFAAQCYKMELETALKSEELAGFQILDLQDFSGQGTALVGILNAFLENKGIITDKEWRQFCAENVLLAALPKQVYQEGETLSFELKLAAFGAAAVKNPMVEVKLYNAQEHLWQESRKFTGDYQAGIYRLGKWEYTIPEIKQPKKLTLQVAIPAIGLDNQYDLWLYPACIEKNEAGKIQITTTLADTCKALQTGGKVLYYPSELTNENSIEGTYCTDFWCYPMFRSISESMNKPVPVGTHGLCINKEHPLFETFPTEEYSTPQWYDVVSNSRAVILDETAVEPVVWTIDNFERNHRLGTIFEASVDNGKLLVCTMERAKIAESITATWLEKSMLQYMESESFAPAQKLSLEQLEQLF